MPEPLHELAAALPEGALLTGEATEPYRRDTADGAEAGVPLAVALPETTEQVAAVVRACVANGLAIVPQGARSGVAGAANAIDGAVMLCLERMTAVLEVSTVDQVARVEAGVRTIELARAAADAGLFYPPDPGSWEISTIGGNVATNAGGMRCVKYGVTRDFVRELTVVLADGEIVRLGHRTVKGVAGLDLVGLMVGSEGTLGIVTEVTVALRPAPAPTAGLSAAFPTAEAALAAAEALVAEPRRPSVLEFLDAGCLVAIDAMIARGEAPGPRLPAAEALLLVQSDGPDAGADVEHYAAIARAHGATLVETADDPARADALMELRRLLHPALRSLRGAVLNEDVSVPRAQLPALLEGIQRLAVDLDVTIVTGGHLGDGNLHPFLAYDPADPDDVARSIRAYLAVIDLAVRLGGTATGEHGVGSLKLPAIEAELGPRVVAAQRAIKAALDPQGLLNPGRKY